MSGRTTWMYNFLSDLGLESGVWKTWCTVDTAGRRVAKR